MRRQNVRVLLASEYPEVRHYLSDVVEEEAGTAIVGQAENATKALTLAKNLRPDVAIIDCYLPHARGLDTVPLSRIGGLDTAQTISEQIPNIRVILLNNLDTGILADRYLDSGIAAIFPIEGMEANIPFTLQALCNEVVQPNALVFASVEAKPRASLGWKVARLSGKDVLFGSLGILGGLSLIWILILAGAEILLSYAGAAIMGLGIGLLIKRAKTKKTKRSTPDTRLLSLSEKH